MPRAVRQTQNRDLFRAVNERIADLSAGFGIADDGVIQGFICECANIGCTEQIQVPPEVYARVVDTPGAYLVGPGHEDVTSEDTVEAEDEYVLVVER